MNMRAMAMAMAVALAIACACPGVSALPKDGTWNDKSMEPATAPHARRGPTPVYWNSPLNPNRFVPGGLDTDGNAFSGNYRLTIPLLRFPGRGLPLALDLQVSSQLWSVYVDAPLTQTRLELDVDKDFPVPGATLGFGKIIVADAQHAMLLSPDNSRQRLQLVAQGSDGQDDYAIPEDPLSDLRIQDHRTATLRRPDGGSITYLRSPDAATATYFPVRISDVHGNFIDIRYLADRAGVAHPPAIDTIVDTTGRVVRFHYGANGLPASITGPGLDGTQRTYARFQYQTVFTSYRVGDPCLTYTIPGGVTGLKGIYFPDTSRAVYFEDPTRYGMIRRVSEVSDATVVATSPEDFGTAVEGPAFERVRSTEYAYPDSFGHDVGCIQGPPEYRDVTSSWLDPVTHATVRATTRHEAPDTQGDDSVTVVRYPDGSGSRQLVSLVTDPARRLVAGLVRRVEKLDSGGALVGATEFEWQADADSGVVRQRAVLEFVGATTRYRRTEFEYGGFGGNLPTKETHLDFSDRRTGAIGDYLWSRTTDYVMDGRYLANHLRTLPRSVRTFTGDTFNQALRSRTDFGYDEFPVRSIGRVPNFARGYTWAQAGLQGTPLYHASREVLRGNLTSVRRFTFPDDASRVLTSEMRYDEAGNVLSAADDRRSGVRSLYDYDTAFSQPAAVTIGAVDPTSALGVTTRTRYDAGTGLPLRTTDADGQWLDTRYRPATGGWRVWQQQRTDGVMSQADDLDASGLARARWLVDASGQIHARTETLVDGAGRTRRVTTFRDAADPGSARVVDVEHDLMGRVTRTSRPHAADAVTRRLAVLHFASGARGLVPTDVDRRAWTLTQYDAAGRKSSVTAPDGSVWRWFHDESTLPPGVPADSLGETVRSVDPWGRERWTQFDANRQVRHVVEPDPKGSGRVFDAGGLLTDYRHEPWGTLISVTGGGQSRSFRYDGVGRLVGQSLPERAMTLGGDGRFVGQGAGGDLTDVFGYDASGNLTAHVDARGVRTVYDYGSDPLNRLHGVRYDLSGPLDPSSVIDPAPSTTYDYVDSGDLRRLHGATVDGVLRETYGYDDHARLSSQTTVFDTMDATPVAYGIAYDGIDRIARLTYPTRFGVAGVQTLDYGYAGDVLGSVKRNDAVMADQFDYAPDGAVRGLRLRTAGGDILETQARDDATGLPTAQAAVDASGAALLSLKFTYKRGDWTATGWTEQPGVTGQLTRIDDLNDRRLTQDFTYDALGRLAVAATGGVNGGPFDAASSTWQAYDYDRFGNRSGVRAWRQVVGRPCQWQPPPCRTVDLDLPGHDGIPSLAFDSATNRISSAGFAYDAAGNMIRGQVVRNGSLGSRTLRYDAAGRLTQVLEGNLNSEFHRYGLGRQRVASSADGVSWRYASWLGNQRLGQFDGGAGGLAYASSSFYIGTRRLATDRPDGLQFHLPDGRGTALTIADRGAGGQASRNRSRPYGTEPGTSLDWARDGERFTSYDRSGRSGLDYAVNRYYDSNLGRFTSPDPLGAAAWSKGDPQALNAYGYALGDPVNRIDPMGTISRAGCEENIDINIETGEWTRSEPFCWVYGDTIPNSPVGTGTWGDPASPGKGGGPEAGDGGGRSGDEGGPSGTPAGQGPTVARGACGGGGSYDGSLGGSNWSPFATLDGPRQTTGFDEVAIAMLAAPVVVAGAGWTTGYLAALAAETALQPLTAGPAGAMVAETMRRISALPYSDRATAFAEYARQIAAANDGWRADFSVLRNGGQLFMGQLPTNNLYFPPTLFGVGGDPVRLSLQEIMERTCR